MPVACEHNGRRISFKKRESRKVFELRRQLNPHVGRRCAPDDRRRFRRPLNGCAASVQHSLNLHLLLCRCAKQRQSWRESCIKKGAQATVQATFVTKQMSALKRVLGAYLDSLFAAISYTSLPSRIEITTIFIILSKASCSSL